MNDVRHARWLFGAAAAFNVAATLATLAQLRDAEGTQVSFLAVAAALVAAFGYAYLRVAQDHRAYRVYVELGIVGKSLAVAAMVAAWAFSTGDGQILVFAAADATFVVLFARFLRQTR